MDVDRAALERLSPERRAQAEAILEARRAIVEGNPLEGFHACARWCGSPDCPGPSERNPLGGRPKQHAFMAAGEFVVASNAGNRFGKTTAMVVWAIIQHCPDELVPDRLREFKRAKSAVVQGRYMCPTEDALEDSILPVFKQWAPKRILRGGAWEKAYRKAPGNTITFADGGKLSFYTYKQDAAVLAGWSGDYVEWDEPPPEAHWREGGPIRVLDRGGCHRFGMTPVNMVGGGIGWLKKKIFDKGTPGKSNYDPRYRVVRASIWDNPDYGVEQVEAILSDYPADERQAREHGDFIHFGGMVYAGGFERVRRPAPTVAEVLRFEAVVVGIDPGLKNAAFIWVGFDNENRAIAFDELLIQEGTPLDYMLGLAARNARWGLGGVAERQRAEAEWKRRLVAGEIDGATHGERIAVLRSTRPSDAPMYVIDPSARNRSLVNGESVEAELQRQGIFCAHGFNAVEAGVQSVRRRITEQGFFVAEGCVGLLGEADEYRMEEGEEFKVVKENDHRLDALRYALMNRPWYSQPEDMTESYKWTPGEAAPGSWINAPDPIGLI